ncbi:MAG: AraC family transcriptional regulator, partial [Mesorhizobium sp.]
MNEALQELIAIAGRHARGRRTRTAVPRVTIGRSEVPTPPLPELCQPTALFVLQGTKSVLIGDRTLRYGAGSCFVYAVETPATSQLIEASAAHPYMAIAFRLDVELIATLLIEYKPKAGGDDFATYPADDELLDAWRRMLRLLDRPAEIPVLAPMLEREIAFRLLQGPQGEKLRQLAHADGRLSQIRRATQWIRAHYNEP